MQLRYGVNPQQQARVVNAADHSLRVLSGAPSYINLLDALNAWPLVREADIATGTAAAASFKHVSPAGLVPSNDAAADDLARAVAAALCEPRLSAPLRRVRTAQAVTPYGCGVVQTWLDDKIACVDIVGTRRQMTEVAGRFGLDPSRE